MADLSTKCIRPSAFSCLTSASYTPLPTRYFGPKRAAIYLGNMYLVVNSLEHIKALAAHFDNLIRIANIGPDRVAVIFGKWPKPPD